jgi:hypothetical protein
VAAAKDAGLSLMSRFFSPKVAPGRPPKKASKAGRPRTEKDLAPPAAAAAAATVPAEAEPKEKKVRTTRQNWAKGDGLKRMSDALSTWEEELAKSEDSRMSARGLAEKTGIPYATLQQHITKNDEKRIKLGDGVGRKPLLSTTSQEVIVDVLIRKDRANEGVGIAGAVDILEEMHPELKRGQIERSFRRTVRPANSFRLTQPVAVQATTTKRTAITVTQQWRWHKVRACLSD